MAEPVELRIESHAGTWRLLRDGREVHSFGHVERATHEAVRLAHELIHTGEPATVAVQAADGRLIAIDLSEPERSREAGGDEQAAITPDRGPSG